MRATPKYILIATCVLAAGAGIYYFTSKSNTEPAAKRPRDQSQVVRIGVAQQKSVPITVTANGYVTAINTVAVRPQIQNVVRKVHVTEGQDVKAGQLLFTLDERADQSNTANAEAQVARVRADLADAHAALKRNQELLSKGFVSQAVVDTARNKADSLRAALKGNQIAVQSSNITLGYNQIKAGISGRIGAISVYPGSLAQPSGDPMLTIAQLDPIAITFSVPERELAHIVASYPKQDAQVVATLSNKDEISGKLAFIDNATDSQSGSIKMKAQFPNADRKMWPGSFVVVRLVSRTLPDAVVIPSQSVVTGPAEKFVYAVQPDSTVKVHKIAVVEIQDEQAIVTGLAAGTRIVFEGTQNLRPGGRVREATAAVPPKPGKTEKLATPS